MQRERTGARTTRFIFDRPMAAPMTSDDAIIRLDTFPIPSDRSRVRSEARAFANPTLISCNDLESGSDARGSIALWLGDGTVAHFRNVTVYRDCAGGDKE